MAAAFLISDDLINFRVARHTKKPANALVRIPDSIPKEDYPFVIGQQVDGEYGSLVWEAIVDDTAKGVFLAGKAKKDQENSLTGAYYLDIDVQMMSVFGTTNRDTAASIYLTWLMMESKPEFYADKGLVDDSDQPLDTATKVYDYATVKIMTALDYSVFLITRRKQFKSDVEALG